MSLSLLLEQRVRMNTKQFINHFKKWKLKEAENTELRDLHHSLGRIFSGEVRDRFMTAEESKNQERMLPATDGLEFIL